MQTRKALLATASLAIGEEVASKVLALAKAR